MTAAEEDGGSVLNLRPYQLFASRYREAGWDGPLPLPFNRKKYPPEDYTGWEGGWPTDEQIEWWRTHSHAGGNICLRLPHGIIGIDVDQYEAKRGAETIAAREAEWGPLPPTVRSSARAWPSGIRLYTVPADRAYVTKLGDARTGGVEIIQFHHRYAVVYPSLNPDVSALYRWYAPDGTELAELPRPDDLTELPEQWVQGLTTTPAEALHVAEDAVTAFYDTFFDPDGDPCGTVRRAAYAWRAKFITGQCDPRHDAGLRAIQDLQHLGAEGHRGVFTALDVVRQAFLVAKTSFPPIRDYAESRAEWQRAVEGTHGVGIILAKLTSGEITPPSGPCDCDTRRISADEALMGEPGVVGEPDPGEPPPFTEQPGDADDEGEGLSREQRLRATKTYAEARLKAEIAQLVQRDLRTDKAGTVTEADTELESATEFLARPLPETKYRIEGAWPAGGNILLAAAWKAGKTTLTGNLVRSLLTGEAFLDRYTTDPIEGTVALLDTEMPPALLQEWLGDQGLSRTDHFLLRSLKGQVSKFNILDPETRALWAQRFKAADTQVLILDNLAPLLDAFELKESTEAGQFLLALDALKAEAGIAELVLVHHMGHTNERARGDSKLLAWPDVAWRLLREGGEDKEPEPNALRFFTAYGRDVEVDESQLAFDAATRHLSIAGGSRRQHGNVEAESAVVAYLTDHPAAKVRDIEAACVVPHGTPGRKAVRDALGRLIRTHRVATENGPNNAILHTYVGEVSDDFFTA